MFVGMLRLDQEAMKKLFQPTIRAIIEVTKKQRNYYFLFTM